MSKPKLEFTRNLKLDIKTLIQFFLTMEGGSLSKEILEYFSYDLDAATAFAFNQQRKKLFPEALEFLFHEFNLAFPGKKKYQGYALLACDGSDINIPRNPDETSTNYLEGNPKLTINREKSRVVSVFAIRNFKFLGFALGRNGKGIFVRVHPKSRNFSIASG